MSNHPKCDEYFARPRQEQTNPNPLEFAQQLEARLGEWKACAERLQKLVGLNMPRCDKLYHFTGQFHSRFDFCPIEEEIESALEEFERLKGIKP